MASAENRPDFLRASAACALQGGQPKDAVEAWKAVPAEKRGKWERMRAARASLAAGNAADALTELGTPEDAWGHLTRGQSLRRLGLNEESIVEFGAALRADPGMALAEQEMGEALVALGRTEEAIREYEAAIALDRSFTHLQLRVSALEESVGRKEAAYARYSKYLLVDTSNPAALAGKRRLAAAAPKLAEAERVEDEARQKYWRDLAVSSLTALPPVPLPPIAVGILKNASVFRVKCSSAVAISSEKGSPVEAPAGDEISGKIEKGVLALSWLHGRYESRGPVDLVPLGAGACFVVFAVHFEPGYYWADVENRTYRGSFSALPRPGGITLVNRVPLEEYLISVIPGEMPSNWPRESLKAQAVAARSETLSDLGRHASDGFDVCSSQHCAVYRGSGSEQESSSRAVLDTRGEIIEAAGKPVSAVYADTCGGWGSSPREVWGSDIPGMTAICDLSDREALEWKDVPVNPDERDRFIYLRPTAWCTRTDRILPAFRWAKSYRLSELESIVNRHDRVGKIKRVTPKSFTPEGRVTSIEVAGAASSEVYKRDGIRSALGGLRSNYFAVEILPEAGGVPAEVIFIGAGWGHGVGLCQEGARNLALAGKGYASILSHYYPGGRLKKIY